VPILCHSKRWFDANPLISLTDLERHAPSSKSVGTIFAAVVVAAAAHAQGYPPAPAGPVDPGRSQACVRLESQLAALDRGIADPAAGEQARRLEETVNRQQFELDRTVAQSRRLGCEGSGFFLFGRGQSPQCVDLNNQIQRMRANLDRAIGDLQRLQGGSADRGEQRQAILGALAVNNCGPQYRSAAPARPRGFFETLFGGPGPATAPDSGPGFFGSPDMSQSSTFRTVCVRTCDGFYFPISFSTVPSKFQDDERQCQQMCPAAEVALFSYRNPGEDMSQAVSTAGKPYTQLPTAFRYRQEFNAACSCKKPGQSWGEALGTNDPTLERGDIIVTEEKAKALSQPKPEPAKGKDARKPKPNEGASDAARTGAAPGAAGAPGAAAAPGTAKPADAASPPDNKAAETDGKRKVRSVGPQFYPVR
jgi:uncharacterized protein DUF2865